MVIVVVVVVVVVVVIIVVAAVVYLYKVTILPGFSRTVLIFNVPEKITQFSRDVHLSRFGLVSRIYPDIDKLRYSTFSLPIYRHMLMHRWPKISSDLSIYTKSCWRPGLHPGPLWGSQDTLPNPQVGPPMAHACATLPYNSCLQHSSWIAVPKLWSPYICISNIMCNIIPRCLRTSFHHSKELIF